MKFLFLLIVFLSFSPFALSHPIDMDAVKQIESGGNPNAYNPRSQAAGLFQITPVCLKHYNESWTSSKGCRYAAETDVGRNSGCAYIDKSQLFDPSFNTLVANWYMNWLYDRCLTVEDTLIAFNWGIGNWKKWDGKIKSLPKETQNYLRKYGELTKGGGQ